MSSAPISSAPGGNEDKPPAVKNPAPPENGKRVRKRDKVKKIMKKVGSKVAERVAEAAVFVGASSLISQLADEENGSGSGNVTGPTAAEDEY